MQWELLGRILIEVGLRLLGFILLIGFLYFLGDAAITYLLNL